MYLLFVLINFCNKNNKSFTFSLFFGLFSPMDFSLSIDLFVIFLLFVFLVPSNSSDRPSLYGPGDNVLELDVNSFDKVVYHKPMAFFVEFYSSWCGHCIEYKPHFVRFATMVKNWRASVVIAVINCADELNAPICREHSIDAFPMLKYFHVNAKGKDDAILYDGDKHNLPLVASKVAQWAKTDFDKGIAPKSWPKLRLEESGTSFSDLWAAAEKNAQFLAIVVDKETTTDAYSLMLNYAGDSRLTVSFCSPSHPIITEKFAEMGLKIPSLFVFSRQSADHPIFMSSSPIDSWVEMQHKLDELLAPFPKNDAPPLDLLLGTKSDAQQQNENGSAMALEKVPKIDWNQFEVQYLDLVSALHYLLTVEVPRNPVLGNTELTALKRFVHLLRLHGPGSTSVRRLFYRLDEWLSSQHQPVVMTDKYLSTLDEIQSDLGHPIPSNTSFMACRGSKPFLRGYTCGLWTLFHLLTVQAYKERHGSPSFDPVAEVLEPIHQFVVQFLSCEICSKNFDKMAREDGLLSVHRPEDVVLWLWRGHNKVNKRLKGEASEDPHFPKQQFPPSELCSKCRAQNGDFDEQKVLRFLLKYYSEVRTDNYKPSASYTIKEFANGKVEKEANRRLNPKFKLNAEKVDKLEEVESRLRLEQEGFKRQWKNIEDNLEGGGGAGRHNERTFEGVADRAQLQFLWLGLFAFALIVVYFKYRQNRSKFWKTFYYMNDYKV